MTQEKTTYERTLRKNDHIRRFAILAVGNGWRVIDSTDSSVLRDDVYNDWHRVERLRREFTIEMTALHDEGWRVS